ncbi:helix-turn-helix domain-containing protein [Sorangium sp. So ce590]|uniref:helix-turn-helix domain-containing protein n=1 Tax=unclassified Sorangium TaxID=2621164 RepID=UPI003F62DCA8
MGWARRSRRRARPCSTTGTGSSEIARRIGSTREAVPLLLGKLKRAGLISFDRRRIVIRDGAHLAARAAAT